MCLCCHSHQNQRLLSVQQCFGPFMTSNHKSEVLITEKTSNPQCLRVEGFKESVQDTLLTEMQNFTPSGHPSLGTASLATISTPPPWIRGSIGRLKSTRFHFIPPLIFKGMKTKCFNNNKNDCCSSVSGRSFSEEKASECGFLFLDGF